MSDITKRAKSVVNPLKVLNQIRQSAGLPKALTKPKAIKITPAEKSEITRQEFLRLYPSALTDKEFILTDEMSQKVAKEVELRLVRIRTGKEPAPQVVVSDKPAVAKAPVGPTKAAAKSADKSAETKPAAKRPGSGLTPKTFGGKAPAKKDEK